MPKQKDLASNLLVSCSSLRYKLPVQLENCVFRPNCTTNTLQTLDQATIRSFKHYYQKQLETKSISMIDHNKLLHVCNAHKSKCFGCTTFHCRIIMLCHTTTVNCFQKCKKFRFHCIQSLSACLSITMFVSPKWHTIGKKE